VNRPSFRALFREKELWLLQILGIVFFAPALFFGKTFFFRDLYLWAFPQRRRLVELVLSEGLPLWDPYIHGGQPFLGEISNVAFYPSGVLGFLLPSVAAFNAEIVLHFLLCGLSIYLLARVVGLSPLGALVAGVVFTYCGYTLSLGNLFNRILAMPHFPFLLLFWHLFLLERRQRWFFASVASGTLQLLAGSAELLILSLLIAIGWSFAFPYPNSLAPWRRVLAAVFLSLSIAGVAAFQLLPSVELVRRSSRGHEREFASSTTWSVDPRRLPEAIVPGFFGRTDTLAETDYWGNSVEDRGFPYILSIYFGVLAAGLAVSGVIGNDTSSLPRRIRILLASLAVFSFLLALGRHFPLFQALHSVFPVVRLFRYPVKFVAGAVLGIALLAGAGAQMDFETTDPKLARHRRAFLAFGATTVLLAVISILLRGEASFARRFETHFFAMSALDSAVAQRISLRFGCAAGFAAVGAFLYWNRGRGRRIRLAPAIATVIALELLPWGRLLNPTAPRSFLTETPPLARVLRPLLAGGRLFRDPDPQSVSLKAPTNEIQWLMRFRRQTLHSYSAASADIPVIFHDDFDGLAPLRLTRLTEFLLVAPWERRIPFLSASGVSLVLTAREHAGSPLEPIGTVPTAANVILGVFRNRAAAPDVGFLSRWHFAPTNAESISRMMRPGFDSRREVVVEGSGLEPSPCAESQATLEFLERRINRSRMRLDTRCEGFLVFSQPFNPDWRLYAGGARIPVVRANSVSSAARLPPGRHELTWVYVPVSLYVGAGITSLTILFAAVAASRRLIRRR
jgi:hypothetical protein